MFGKKPAASTPPPQPAQPTGWAMQALTTDYAVSGLLAPMDTPLVGYLNVPTQAADRKSVV